MKRFVLLALFLFPIQAAADPAEVIAVSAAQTASGWTFDVTLAHGDTGWEDYADGWRIELADGTIIGERPLAHPHVHEQPFTRATSGVTIPADVAEVFIRTRTTAEGWAETATAFALTR